MTESSRMTAPPRTRRSSKETLEDYTLRYAPSHYRRWGPAAVATTALGGMAYLADFAIGASIGLAYGTVNALLAILAGAVIIFCTGLPVAVYGARYNIDLDLVSRGSGFGYYGSVITNIVFATFTFIFFALEGSIMAQGLHVGLGVPLWLGYLLSTVIIIPIVVYGMAALSKMQIWTTPIWLVLMFAPFVHLAVNKPEAVQAWLGFQGTSGTGGEVSLAAVGLGAGVVLALMGQIGEQIDYLRFMPAETKSPRAWWAAVLLAGPGWVGLGALKQAAGVFLAVYVLSTVGATSAVEPVQQFMVVFQEMLPPWLAVTLAVALVVISQVKINATNAYSGSLAWTNSFTRVTKRYPGRLVFIFFNVGIALVLMEANMFAVLNSLLGFYSNCAIAWVTVVAADIVFNKYLLRLSPRRPEFRRAYLHAFNPVGVASFTAATLLSFATFFGLLGATLRPYSPFVALLVALVLTPLMAAVTGGRYYLARPPADLGASTHVHNCNDCSDEFEAADMVECHFTDTVVCSLCCSTHPHDKETTAVVPA